MDGEQKMVLIAEFGGIAPTEETTIDSGDWPCPEKHNHQETS